MPRRIPENRLKDLLECATRVFIDQGYRRAQMADVASALGVAKGTPYLYVESTANLDHQTAYRIINLMRRLRDELGTSFVFSTHDPKIMGEAEVTFELEDGRLTRQGEGAVS